MTVMKRKMPIGIWIFIWAAFLISIIFGLRYFNQPAASLDLTKQSKDPAKAIPGAGKIPVVEVGRKNGLRLLTHIAGTSAVPEKPQRIITLGWTDELLAIGVKPIAASADTNNQFPDYLQSRLEGVIPLTGNAGAPNLEILADLKPDLILTAWWWKPLWPQLEKIAPTVMLQPAHWEWRYRVRDIAFVCGKVEEGERALTACDKKLEEIRENIANIIPGKSVAILRIFAREFRLYGYAYSGPLLYGDLALPVPKVVTDFAWKEEAARLSLEGMSLLDADVILLMTDDGDRIPITNQIVDKLLHHPLWLSLKAVKQKQVFQVPNRFMRGGVISRIEMSELLLKLVEGT
jgi:iron complex transport system substrate-binding protein